MPRVPDPERLAFFLYPDEQSAMVGGDSGATGFIVTIPYSQTIDPNKDQHHYVVTNEHVVNRFDGPACVGALTVRIHTDSGSFFIKKLPFENWILDKAHDLAICPIDLEGTDVDVLTFAQSGIISDDLIDEGDIGVGDDIFMVGRFVDHPSVNKNEPVTRFGNISKVIRNEDGNEEWYFGDMHSRTGYSGSPVVVFRTPNTNLNQLFREEENPHVVTSHQEAMILLLGTHTGSFPETWKIEKNVGGTWEEAKDLRTLGASGLSKITPARFLLDLLDDEDLEMQRKEKEKEENPNGAPSFNPETS